MIRPNKVEKKFLVLLPGQFFAKLKQTHTHTHTITKGHYEWKYIQIQAVMLLNTYKNLENIHACIT